MAANAGPSLSPRQRQIVMLIAQGQPTKAIADALRMSPWTVTTHLRRIFTRFDVHTRAEMVARLAAEGLFSPTAGLGIRD